MRKIKQYLQLGCFTLLFTLGTLHLSNEEAQACEIGGDKLHFDRHDDWDAWYQCYIWGSGCIMCVDDPIE